MKVRLLFFVLLIYSAFCFCQRSDFSLAENYLRNSEYEKATQLYKKLVHKSPFNSTYLQRLITCYQETDKYQDAEALLFKKIAKRPKMTFLNVIIGHNYERQQKKDLADKYYKKAITSIKDKASYGVNIANLFKGYNKLDYAIQAYNKVLKANPDANYGFQLAQIYGEKGDFEAMFNAYVDYLDSNDNYLHTVKRYSARYITDDAEDNNNILFKQSLLRKSASNPKAVWNDLLSWLFIRQKDYSKAYIQQKALYARDPENIDGIKELSEIAFENKDYETAKECSDFIIKKTNYISDKFEAIRLNLLIAVETKAPDTEDQFQAIFKEFGVNSNTFFIQITYADYLTFEKNQPQIAKTVLEKALPLAESKYQKARVKLKLADVLVYQGIFNKALIYFSQVQTRFKNHYLGQEANFKVAQTSYFKNDFKWAKAQLKVLKGSTSQLIANDAADLFLTISDNEPKDSVPSGLKEYAKADLLAYQNKNTKAITILNTIVKTFKGQPIEDEALFKLGELYSKQKRYTDAIASYSKILDTDKDGVLIDDAYYFMAELYNTKLNNTEKASEYYQKIIFEHPSSIYLVDARKQYRKLRGDEI